MGTGLIIPWNAIINSVDWLNERYEGQHTEFLFSVAYMVRPHVASGGGRRLCGPAWVKVLDLLFRTAPDSDPFTVECPPLFSKPSTRSSLG